MYINKGCKYRFVLLYFQYQKSESETELERSRFGKKQYPGYWAVVQLVFESQYSITFTTFNVASVTAYLTDPSLVWCLFVHD